MNELRNKLKDLNSEIKEIKTQLNPRSVTKTTVIDEIKEWQTINDYKEDQWVWHLRQLRANRIGENAWLLNELLREYELESKRNKRYAMSDNLIEFGPELIRVPELLFSPKALINYPQMGVSEAIEEMVKQLDNPSISQVIIRYLINAINVKVLYIFRLYL